LSERSKVCFTPIGVVHTEASDDQIRNVTPGQKSTIEIYSEYEEALDGLSGFSHIFVLGYFNRLRPEQVGPLKVKPRGLMKYGAKLEELPLVGVLALDSPTRPNPIGLSLVPLLEVNGTRLDVTDLDLFNETPVLDIKPYQQPYRTESYRLPAWHTKLSERWGHV
jgi:tRNA (adenine37-N6)-methyltransferase